MVRTAMLLGAAALLLAGCGETAAPTNQVQANDSAEQANDISSEPFGATGAPGADLTDNGATDASAGFSGNDAAEVPTNAL